MYAHLNNIPSYECIECFNEQYDVDLIKRVKTNHEMIREEYDCLLNLIKTPGVSFLNYQHKVKEYKELVARIDSLPLYARTPEQKKMRTKLKNNQSANEQFLKKYQEVQNNMELAENRINQFWGDYNEMYEILNKSNPNLIEELQRKIYEKFQGFKFNLMMKQQ
eukprot:Mrub_11755.p1 GENE.Mrub_11755~~Mrub_11755.p1  ORF type:complete len:164 (-),score=23.27 Mrub_11755:87-578(-)